MQKIEIILKKGYNEYLKEWQPIIFFRDIKHLEANTIEFFDGSHNQASLDYFRSLKPASIKEATSLLEIFKNLYKDYQVIIKKKLKY